MELEGAVETLERAVIVVVEGVEFVLKTLFAIAIGWYMTYGEHAELVCNGLVVSWAVLATWTAVLAGGRAREWGWFWLLFATSTLVDFFARHSHGYFLFKAAALLTLLAEAPYSLQTIFFNSAKTVIVASSSVPSERVIGKKAVVAVLKAEEVELEVDEEPTPKPTKKKVFWPKKERLLAPPSPPSIARIEYREYEPNPVQWTHDNS